MSLPATEMFVRAGNTLYQAASLAEASAMYCAARDMLGNGASGTPTGEIVDAEGNQLARISYNGKVWPPADWRPDMAPLFVPE